MTGQSNPLLLAGAVDLHRHGFPELSNLPRPPREDVEDITLCRDAGMAAVVLKSHLWPTVGRAHLLNGMVDGIDVLPSITLNSGAGGMTPAMVEFAALQGARVIFFPTWSSAHDQQRGGISTTMSALLRTSRLSEIPPIPILDANGRLRPEVNECLAVARAHDMVVYTGHLMPAEALALAESGSAAGRLVLSHPDSHSVAASWPQAVSIADAGAYVEITALGIFPQIGRTTAGELAELVGAVGAERCVMTSDYFFDWAPPSHQMLQHLADGLLGAGVAARDVRAMLVDNPRQLVGMPAFIAAGAHA